MRLFGLAILRNGIKYDYPFEESLISLSPLTEKIYLALGKSEDGTEELVSSLPFIKIIPTIWDENLRQGGLILSQQTNVALSTLRKEQHHDRNVWAFYLQSDEVIHEQDYPTILADLNFANAQGYDAVRFRYLHFWQNHNKIAINKKWYPSEIRAIRAQSKISSWGDAQSFCNMEKVFDSNATIYHYGHVREKNSYKKKKGDILKLYHQDENLPKYQKKEKKFDDQTECLSFYGVHPQAMKNRIKKFSDTWILPEVSEVGIIIKENIFSGDFLNRINSNKIILASSEKSPSLANLPKNKIINWNKSFPQSLIWPDTIPLSMRSKLAQPWTPEFRLILKLSEINIGMKK